MFEVPSLKNAKSARVTKDVVLDSKSLEIQYSNKESIIKIAQSQYQLLKKRKSTIV